MTAAAVLTIVSAVLAGIALAVVAGFLATRRDQLLDQAGGNPALESFSRDQLGAIMVGASLVMVVWCLVAVGLAVLVLRRSSVGRILLVVSAAGSAAFSLIAILSIVSALTLLTSLATIVLLFTGGANAWFAGTPAGTRRAPAASPLDSLAR